MTYKQQLKEMNNSRFKFRVWNGETMISPDYIDRKGFAHWKEDSIPVSSNKIMQFTGLKDKNGKEIYEGDILRFADKWEWYRTKYGIPMYFADSDKKKKLKAQYDAEPYEERVVDDMREEWIQSDEIQTYWEIIGNIHESKHL